MPKNLKVGLFYGQMREHAEWIKHEAVAKKIEVTLFEEPTENPEQLNEFDAVFLMAYSGETSLIKEFSHMSFILNELDIPFVWAVDKHNNPLAYKVLNNFEELGSAQAFLNAMFELAEDTEEKNPQPQNRYAGIANILKKRDTAEKEQEDFEQPNQELEPLTSYDEDSMELDELPPLQPLKDEGFSFDLEDDLIRNDTVGKEDYHDVQPEEKEEEVYEEHSLLAEPSQDEDENQIEDSLQDEQESFIDEELKEEEFGLLEEELESVVPEKPKTEKPIQQMTHKVQPAEHFQLEQESIVEEEIIGDIPAKKEPEHAFSIFNQPQYELYSGSVDPYEEVEEEITVDRLPNVIAVAGAGHGVGTSFVSLNLAYAVNATLLEGKRTGTLAEWLNKDEVVDRESFLHGEARGKYPVMATKPLKSRNEFNMLKVKSMNHLYVVDTEVGSPVWERAGHKVFVMTPDPQFRNINIPIDAKVVLNKAPKNFPVNILKLIPVHPDLIINENTREVYLSLWGQAPYLMKQDPQTIDSWASLIGKNNSKAEEDNQWNLENPL